MLKTRKMIGSWMFGGLVGIAVSFVIIVSVLLIIALLVLKGNVSLEAAKIIILPIVMVVSYIGCLLAGSLTNDNKLLGCITTFSVMVIVRLLLTLFTYEENLGNAVAYSIPELMGVALALLTVAKRGGKVRTKKIKKRYL